MLSEPSIISAAKREKKREFFVYRDIVMPKIYIFKPNRTITINFAATSPFKPRSIKKAIHIE